MRISPVLGLYNKTSNSAKSIKNNTNNTNKTQTNSIGASNINFKSIFADANAANQYAYGYQTRYDSQFARLKNSSTRILRELETQMTVCRGLNPNEKTQIKILGCADGSEAWGYAIALNEVMGEKARENVKIQAVDIEPSMVALAKTGKIVCSDVEKEYAENALGAHRMKSPLSGKGWDKYLKKSKAPDEFPSLLKKYPHLKYVEYDPIVEKKIGSGLEWYEVNKEILPEVTFECGDMLDNLSSDDEAKNVVYVVANSAAYLFEKSPAYYMEIFDKVAMENRHKDNNVLVVTGKVEQDVLSTVGTKVLGVRQRDIDMTKRTIRSMGFENAAESRMRKLGANDYKSVSKNVHVFKK